VIKSAYVPPEAIHREREVSAEITDRAATSKCDRIRASQMEGAPPDLNAR
jgi:hypothetical protein